MIIRWKPVSMDHFAGEFNSHKTDVIREANGWSIFVDEKKMKLKPFRTAKQARSYCENGAQRVILKLAQQNIQADQHLTLLPQAA